MFSTRVGMDPALSPLALYQLLAVDVRARFGENFVRRAHSLHRDARLCCLNWIKSSFVLLRRPTPLTRSPYKIVGPPAVKPTTRPLFSR